MSFSCGYHLLTAISKLAFQRFFRLDGFNCSFSHESLNFLHSTDLRTVGNDCGGLYLINLLSNEGHSNVEFLGVGASLAAPSAPVWPQGVACPAGRAGQEGLCAARAGGAVLLELLVPIPEGREGARLRGGVARATGAHLFLVKLHQETAVPQLFLPGWGWSCCCPGSQRGPGDGHRTVPSSAQALVALGTLLCGPVLPCL